MCRSAVYLCVACMGNPEDYETMVQLHRASDLPEEKQWLVRLSITEIIFYYISVSAN